MLTKKNSKTIMKRCGCSGSCMYTF